jgi:hypothetical protein
LGLCATVLRTHFIINDLIFKGDIIEASTLIRKQLETCTRLEELDTKNLEQLKKKTPNVINQFKNAGKRIYPLLSEIAHSGSERIPELIAYQDKNRNLRAVNIYPLYTEDLFIIYNMHGYVSLNFLKWYIQFAIKLYDETYDYGNDSEILFLLVSIAEKCGIIENTI